jgi:hypothetical protein
MDSRVEHEAAVGLARRLVQIVSPCLRPEEQHEALREFYEVVRAGLEEYRAKVRVEPHSGRN